MTPAARTLKHLKTLGYHAQKVEQTIPKTFIKRDCFGVDVLALKPGEILVVQCTSGAHVAERMEKLKATGHAALWRAAGAAIEVWGWSKQGPRGKRKTWMLRREPV